MTHSLFEIPELADVVPGRSLVRIPMEQDVPFTPRVRAIVDTPAFQRLAGITQLGLAVRVYPGATHSRFEHALGVFHNAIRYLRQLARDSRFAETVDAHTAEVLLVSALLHDVGHWPFCHPIEDMGLPDLPSHEEFAAEYLGEETELTNVLRTEWNIEPAEVLEVLTGTEENTSLKLVRSILSGPIDIDKMDYLDRDSLHAGVPYGRNFDKNRLIQSLLVNETGDGLAISSKGKTAAELMVFARYVMFSEVYWHHAVRSATCMFARAFYDLHRDVDLRSFFRKSEQETIQTLRRDSAGLPCERLIEGVFGPKRELYKRVAEYSLYQSPEIYSQLARRPYSFLISCSEKLAELLTAKFQQGIDSTDLLIDAPPPDREIEFRVQIYFAKENVYRPLHKVSPVIEALARTQFDDYVKRVRIFANSQLAEQIAKCPDFENLLGKAVTETVD
ncbi:MAG: HD domain-containing protein [Planctomycetaceae bacterium]